MEKLSKVAFFGHSNYNYIQFREKLEEIIADLIENHGASIFYNGSRGNFDFICASIVNQFKEKYPKIINLKVLSYYPHEKLNYYSDFDDTIYLLDKPVLPKFAIYYTNRKMVDISDYIVTGVRRDYGGA